MKRLGFLFFVMAVVGVTFSSSTCRPQDDPEPIELPCDTCGTGGGGPHFDKPGTINIKVKLYTDGGFDAGGARVAMALTLDSAQQGKYINENITDGNGNVTFANLYAKTLKDSVLQNHKYYYFDAWQMFAGDSLTTDKSSNPHQHKEIRVQPSQIVNEVLVINL